MRWGSPAHHDAKTIAFTWLLVAYYLHSMPINVQVPPVLALSASAYPRPESLHGQSWQDGVLTGYRILDFAVRIAHGEDSWWALFSKQRRDVARLQL